MKYLLKFLLVLFTFFIGGNLFGQEKKLAKAKNQYNNYQYIDAQETYLKVAEKGYRSVELFSHLGDSYYFNSQFEEALYWYQELVISYPDKIKAEYYFRYAQTLKSAKRFEESDIYMKEFVQLSKNDKRAQLFDSIPNYLERIELQSGRYTIENATFNTSFTDFGAAFYGDNIVFSSSRDTLILKNNVHQWNNEAFLDLFVTHYDSVNNSFSKSKKFNDRLNSKFHESTAIFTKDESTVYFTRNNFDGEKFGKDQEGTNRLKIFRSSKNGEGEWSKPQSLSFNSNEYSTAHPALSTDEKTLYFSSDMPGGQGASDLYEVAIKDDGSFGKPKNLGSRINTEGKETFPFISEKGDLYFSSDGHIGLGGLDVFVTKLKPTTKEEKLAINMGKPINGPKDDFAFIVSDTSKRGYFSSNREGGKGKDDIYHFMQLEDLKTFCEITITGVVKDGDTEEIISGAVVTIYNEKYDVIEVIEAGDDGMYATTNKIECGAKYFIRIEKLDYSSTEMLITTPDETQTVDLSNYRDLRLVREVKVVQVGDDLAKILQLKPIYFDFNDYLIRPDAKVELAKVIEVMKQYPNLKIEVRSHTDSRASAEYNKKLSSRRARKTLNYIAIIGAIDRNRLSSRGYGEEELLNDCVYGVKCSEEEHEKNRRSEFIIIDQ
ncbi:OmpA family protein [Aquimarina celericrescens]|uniref:OmpA family protein n=2 Tax=Aquimarina celericrescens TaxID=1964542 RepID=A0ABW5AWJ4_9FLAO|nr:OmpA family protein [Aquimarina celericrescens]